MNENKAVAILLANLDGSKNKPSKVSDMSLAYRTLRTEYGWSMTQLSELCRVCRSTLYELGRIADLEPEFLAMADQKHIGMSVAYLLTKVDKARRAEAAALLPGMHRKWVRDLVFYLTTYPDMPVQEAKRQADKLRPKVVHVVVGDVSDAQRTSMENTIARSGRNVQSRVVYVPERVITERLPKNA